MKNKIIRLKDKNWKVLGFTDDMLIYSNHIGHKTVEDLLASTQKKKAFERIRVIKLESISGIIMNEKLDWIKFEYSEKESTKKVLIEIKDIQLRNSLATSIAEQCKLTKGIVEESKTKPLMISSISCALVLGVTFLLRGVAIDMQNGVVIEASGRRSGRKQLILDAVEALGPMWVTIIGIALALVITYSGYCRYMNPAKETKFS